MTADQVRQAEAALERADREYNQEESAAYAVYELRRRAARDRLYQARSAALQVLREAKQAAGEGGPRRKSDGDRSNAPAGQGRR